MDCRGFDRWLGAGRPEAQREEAHAHEMACASCAQAGAVSQHLERLLGTPLATADAGFTSRVLLRVGRRALDERTASIGAELLLPWWTQILREPAALAGLALGTLAAAGATWVAPPGESGATLLSAWLAAWSAFEDVPALLLAGMGLPLAAGLVWGAFRIANAAFAWLGDAGS